MKPQRMTVAALAGAVLLAGATAQAADAKTIRVLSRAIPSAGGLFDANDNPLTDDQAPAAGSYFIGMDNIFRGNHDKHGAKPIGWDHVTCTILDPATFAVKCDAQLSLPGGMIVSDRQTVSFSAPTQKFKITGATGRYRAAKGGTLTARSIGEGDDSDLVI